MDRASVNPWFLLVIFFGSPALTAVAGVLSLGAAELGWIAATDG